MTVPSLEDMDEELVAACHRWLNDGLPATVPSELKDKNDLIPISVDIDDDVAAVAVLRWWEGPPERPASAPRLPRPIIEVRGFCLVNNSWKITSGGVGSIVDDYPLPERPSVAELGTYLQWQGGGSLYAGDIVPDTDLYIHDARLRASAQVSELQVGSRRLTVPAHGYLVVAWSSKHPDPTVDALAMDGAALTSLDLGQMPGASRHHRP